MVERFSLYIRKNKTYITSPLIHLALLSSHTPSLSLTLSSILRIIALQPKVLLRMLDAMRPMSIFTPSPSRWSRTASIRSVNRFAKSLMSIDLVVMLIVSIFVVQDAVKD